MNGKVEGIMICDTNTRIFQTVNLRAYNARRVHSHIKDQECELKASECH